jgi:hypothetical protein
MTDLHWALLAVAGALLLAIWLYGVVQERRTVARLDKALRRDLADPLGGARPPATPTSGHRRIEPRLDSSPGDALSGDASPLDELPTEPMLAPAADGARGGATPSAARELNDAESERAEPSAYALPDGWVEDPLLDFVIELRCAHPIDGVSALEARSQLDRLQLPLPTHLAVWDARGQQWTAPDRFGFYSELMVAVQMAHRNGSLGEIDATRFVSTTQQIALAIDADFDAPDVARLVAQAAQLDALSARFDVQITLTIVAADAPWTADLVQAAATSAGFVPVASGRWELRDAAGLILVLTSARSPAESLALSIDVPLVRPETSPLAKQYAVADQLAASLGGRVVDDNGRPVQREAHFAVAAQLAGLYEQMHAAGITAGSDRARRLYAA